MSPIAVIASVPEHVWHWIIACTPFVAVIDGKAKVNTGMVVQALIVAGVGGAIVAYINLSKLEVKFDAIMDEIVEIKQDNKEGFKRMDRKIEKIQDDFYKPRIGG